MLFSILIHTFHELIRQFGLNRLKSNVGGYLKFRIVVAQHVSANNDLQVRMHNLIDYIKAQRDMYTSKIYMQTAADVTEIHLFLQAKIEDGPSSQSPIC